MKRITAAFLAVLLLVMCVATLPAYADDTDNQSSQSGVNVINDVGNVGNVNSCTYDAASKSVNISGTINHDILITHSTYTISLFAIPMGSTLSEVVDNPETKPLAISSISIKFDFSVKIKSVTDILSRYAVTIVSATGEMTLVCPPAYPSVASSYSYTAGDRSDYKGISTSSLSVEEDINPATAIVPVFLNSLVNNGSTGYLYGIDGSYIFFDSDYINSLDMKIRSLSAAGCRVYLQFLLPSGSDALLCGTNAGGVLYDMPDVRISDVQQRIYAFCDYLSDRYSSYENGSIAGIIVGRQLDDADSYNNCAGVSSVEEYAALCGFYALTVANVARSNIPSLDIVIPLSGRNCYTGKQDTMAAYSPSELIAELCSYFDNNFRTGFNYTLLLESSASPFGITKDNIANGVDTAHDASDGYIRADNIEIFTEYLSAVAANTPCTPKSFIFQWSVADNVTGNALSCAYAYSFYKLLTADRLSSFVVSFTDVENESQDSIFGIKNILKYIDTSESYNVTKELPAFFGEMNWYNVISNMYSSVLGLSKVIGGTVISSLPDGIAGTFTYFDFTVMTGISSWYAGSFCDSPKIDYGKIVGRAMAAHFDVSDAKAGEYGNLLCVYEYPENFIYTPYMSFGFCIEDDGGSKEPLYEVRIIIGTDGKLTEVSKIVSAGENDAIISDISLYTAEATADYIRVAVRCVSGDSTGYTFWLSSVKGHSTVYSDEELAGLISSERLSIRNQSASDEQKHGSNTVLIIAAVVAVVLIVAVALFIILRRDDE